MMKDTKKILVLSVLVLGILSFFFKNALVIGGLRQTIADPGPSNVVVTEEM